MYELIPLGKPGAARAPPRAPLSTRRPWRLRRAASFLIAEGWPAKHQRPPWPRPPPPPTHPWPLAAPRARACSERRGCPSPSPSPRRGARWRRQSSGGGRGERRDGEGGAVQSKLRGTWSGGEDTKVEAEDSHVRSIAADQRWLCIMMAEPNPPSGGKVLGAHLSKSASFAVACSSCLRAPTRAVRSSEAATVASSSCCRVASSAVLPSASRSSASLRLASASSFFRWATCSQQLAFGSEQLAIGNRSLPSFSR